MQAQNQSFMTRTGEQRVQKGSKRGSAGAVAFKYYIHDTAQGYALQMSGPFTEAAITELSGCWQTAKTTLKDRSLTLDMRELTSVDEPAEQWLASMELAGAKRLQLEATPVKRCFLGRLSGRLRGCTA